MTFTLSSAGSTLKGVGVETSDFESAEGLLLNGGTVEDVAITGGGNLIAQPVGLRIDAGVFRHGTVEMDEEGTNTAVNFGGPGGEMTDSTIMGRYGVQGSTTMVLRRCRISSGLVGIETFYPKLTVEDSLIDLRGSSSARGVAVAANGTGNATATLRGLTIVNGGANSIGLEVRAYAKSGVTSNVLLEDSVLYGLGHAVRQETEGSGMTAEVKTAYSSYEAAGDVIVEKGGADPLVAEHPVSGAAGFVGAVLGDKGFSEGDWRLAASSPLIDAGAPGVLAGGESETDLAGNPRIVHGRRDVGAYEYQWRAPEVGAWTSNNSPFAGQYVTLSGSASAPEPGDAITSYQWSFDDGGVVPAGASAVHYFKTAGMHTATLTATDALGVTGSATVQLSVRPVTVCIVEPCGGCGESQKCFNPLNGLSGLSIKPVAFKAAHRGGSVASARAGARVTFTMHDVGGAVTFTVARVVHGVKLGNVCLAPGHGRHGGRCILHLKLHGSFTRQGGAGSNSFRFTGRLAGRTLAKGSYVLSATDTIGHGHRQQAAFLVNG